MNNFSIVLNRGRASEDPETASLGQLYYGTATASDDSRGQLRRRGVHQIRSKANKVPFVSTRGYACAPALLKQSS